jgi:acetylglutamate kinase
VKSILIKYGGNAMTNQQLKESVIANIADLHRSGHEVTIVHGGGPFIKNMLDLMKIKSEFIGGHRKTSKEAIKFIEMTLKGEVNSDIVTLLGKNGINAVGLSGKDARLALAKRRYHEDGDKKVDIGLVGDIREINTAILKDLMEKSYLPVVACIAADADGQTYNVNADMMAGALAGALKVDEYIALTDTDGLRKDKDDPQSLIAEISSKELKPLFGSSIQGGMIPKIESCMLALKNGVGKARIINGTVQNSLNEVLRNKKELGTTIVK